MFSLIVNGRPIGGNARCGQAACVDADADAMFPEGLTSREMFEAMGFKMVIWPVSGLRVANKAQAELSGATAARTTWSSGYKREPNCTT